MPDHRQRARKVVATNSALTHCQHDRLRPRQVMGENPDCALMFVAPMDAERRRRLDPAPPMMVAGADSDRRTTYPLSSRFDENDAILEMDKVLIPWENVLTYRDFDRRRSLDHGRRFCLA